MSAPINASEIGRKMARRQLDLEVEQLAKKYESYRHRRYQHLSREHENLARQLREIQEQIGADPVPAPAGDIEAQVSENLNQAEHVANVGAAVPEFEYHGPVKAWFARRVARVVLFLAGIFTSHQRLYNHAVLNLTKALLRRVDQLGLEALEERRARLAWMEENVGLAFENLDFDARLAHLEERAQRTEEALRNRFSAQLMRLEENVQTLQQSLAASLEPLREDVTRISEWTRRFEDRRAREAIPEFDTFYKAFEDRFRGSREETAERLSVYLPIFDDGRAGTPQRPLVDLGCGRGEWLDLLRQRGLKGSGVDTNQVFIQQCRAQGHEVVESDVLEYLYGVDESTIGGITSFHLVEHVTPGYVMKLLEQCHRVLVPGGFAILETPNPENVLVGACTFHCDPTHSKPLFPPTLRFLMEYCGFVDVELRWLREGRRVEDKLEFLDGGEPTAAALNPVIEIVKRHFLAPPDYCVIGRKSEKSG